MTLRLFIVQQPGQSLAGVPHEPVHVAPRGDIGQRPPVDAVPVDPEWIAARMAHEDRRVRGYRRLRSAVSKQFVQQAEQRHLPSRRPDRAARGDRLQKSRLPEPFSPIRKVNERRSSISTGP
jgi:hypothetical protein